MRINGAIETPPDNNRALFRQSVLDTILHILKTERVSVEYIGYKPDPSGVHPIDQEVTEYDDCIYVSMNVTGFSLNPLDGTTTSDDLVATFVDLFESKTHRHLAVESAVVRKASRQRFVEMSSDWKLYLRHG
ncbi:hypothetical protein [Flavobacterium caeni]|nr:hypothetical protein [Flavobacterium caeni]